MGGNSVEVHSRFRRRQQDAKTSVLPVETIGFWVSSAHPDAFQDDRYEFDR